MRLQLIGESQFQKQSQQGNLPNSLHFLFCWQIHHLHCKVIEIHILVSRRGPRTALLRDAAMKQFFTYHSIIYILIDCWW